MKEDKTIQANSRSICKVDAEFKIIFANKHFLEDSGYSIEEIINESIHMFRHVDMPQIIITKLIRSLKEDLNYNVISINRTKNGETYWIVNQVSIDRDSDGDIVGYTSERKILPNAIIEKIEPFYNNLLEIEKVKGPEVSEIYFDSYLKEEMNKSYQEYIVYLFKEEAKKSKKEKSLSSKTLDWFFNSKYL